MIKRKNTLPEKVQGSALLSSVLVLATCLLFFKLYQNVLAKNIQNDRMIIEYVENN